LVLADLKGTGGYVSKDTVVGGYGSRLRPFSKVTRVLALAKQVTLSVPSVQLAYLAAMAARAGHEVQWTSGEMVDGDLVIVLSSLVDYRHEIAWADRMRSTGARVGFVGLAASKLPELFVAHADFVIRGEPETAFADLLAGRAMQGVIDSPEVANLDDLPFPRWDGAPTTRRTGLLRLVPRPLGTVFPVLASRSCPEFCTYCPHRILTSHRMRSIASIIGELSALCDAHRHPYVVFRDPLFTDDRDRVLALADEIRVRRLPVRFDCETRLDRLDEALIDAMRGAGLRALNFGVETMSPITLKRAGRRPIPEAQQRAVIDHCRRRGVHTAAFYVFGFAQDTRETIAATIEYAVALRSTFAQFKILTPYPATPMFKQLASDVYETDWQKFDGFTPTFRHPHLTGDELRTLLGAAYTRFYMRPSYLADVLRLEGSTVRDVIEWLDLRVAEHQARTSLSVPTRPSPC
jgi:radical SAM superfamily enzyme YgiQ (UPF0313 family)